MRLEVERALLRALLGARRAPAHLGAFRHRNYLIAYTRSRAALSARGGILQ